MLIKTYRIPKALIKEEVTDEQHQRGDRKLEDSSHRSIKCNAANCQNSNVSVLPDRFISAEACWV